MPTRYRERIADRSSGQLIATVDRDYCLLIYPLPDWEEIERKLMRLPSFDRKARRLQRLMVGHATEMELDSNGRVLVSRELREFAHLERRAILIGQGNRFELWDEALWSEKRDAWLAEEDADSSDLSAELETLVL